MKPTNSNKVLALHPELLKGLVQQAKIANAKNSDNKGSGGGIKTPAGSELPGNTKGSGDPNVDIKTNKAPKPNDITVTAKTIEGLYALQRAMGGMFKNQG